MSVKIGYGGGPPAPEAMLYIEFDVARGIPRLLTAGWRQRQRAGDGLGMWDQARLGLRLIHSVAKEWDGLVWGHVSLSRRDGTLPSWEEVRDAQWLIYPEDPGLIVVAPADEHWSNPAPNAAEVHHVWTCRSKRVTPDFRRDRGGI